MALARENTALYIALALAGLYAFRNNLTGIGSSIGTGAASIVTGIAQGAGAAINSGIINPIAQELTGDPTATMGGAVYDWFNNGGLPASVKAVFPASDHVDYNGNIYDISGAMVGYVTDDDVIRDVAGHPLGKILVSDMTRADGYMLANYAKMIGK